MKVLITGGLGFVGTQLSARLLEKGHTVTIVDHSSFLKVPGFMMRAILGEFGSVLLEGQRVIPGKLLRAGFAFHYPQLVQALKDVITG